MVFRVFWILTRKTCVFAGKFLAGLSKILLTCPMEHLRRNISERKSWKLKDFWKIFEVFGTIADNIFKGWQHSIKCPRERFMEIFLNQKKSLFFFQFWAIVYFQRNFLPQLRNPQSTYPWKFLGKKSFEIYVIFHTSLDFDPKNAWSVIFFPGCHNCNPRVLRHFLRKIFFFFKKIIFVHPFWSLSKLVCFLAKKCQGVTKQPNNTEENWRIKFVNFVFLNHFWTSSRKVWTTLEKETRRIVTTTFKVFKGTISGRFFQMKKLWSSCLVVERNYWAFGVNFLSKLLKTAAYRCSGKF